MIEGSGSIPLTNGSVSGSGRPKKMWIRWIRIRNIATKYLGTPIVRRDGGAHPRIAVHFLIGISTAHSSSLSVTAQGFVTNKGITANLLNLRKIET
jgi:hypothetical protein